MRVPLANLGLRSQDIDVAISVLRSGNLTMGSKVLEFEKRMANYLGVSHFVMVNSGSSANLAIIEALLRPALGEPKLVAGDRVLVPSIAWPTTIWPLIQLGLQPHFVDVDIDNLSIDLKIAQQEIDLSDSKIAAIFPIHPLGMGISPSNLDEFVNKNELVLINDVCESLGSFVENQHAGVSGLAASFSFYFSHHMTTMEGGGIATNDANFADDLRSIRSHGWSRDRHDKLSWTHGVSFGQEKFLFVSTGFNIRPMEIQAAIGLSQLDSLENFIARRRYIASRVDEVLKDSDIKLLGRETLANENLSKSHSWMHLPIYCDLPRFNREKALQYLENIGIETRPVLTGNFLAQPAISKVLANPQSPENFTNASLISDRGFLIGCHHDLSDLQIDYLCKSLSDLVKNLNDFKT